MTPRTTFLDIIRYHHAGELTMNKNDFKNPLIQSGAVLLLVFLLISIVAGSGSQGLLGSIGALISGLFSAILFVVALCIAIVFSIAVIIGIYLAAVALYSGEKGRDLFEQLKSSLAFLYARVRGTTIKYKIPSRQPAAPEPQPAQSSAPVSSATPQPPPRSAAGVSPAVVSALEAKIEAINSMLTDLTHYTSTNAEKIAELQRRLDASSEPGESERPQAAAADPNEAVNRDLQELRDRIEASSGALQQLEQDLSAELDGVKQDLASLHDKTSVPEVVSGILSYIDAPEDRDAITEKAKEAISRGMTYSQIDEFFKASLSDEVYQELAAHPRLTKDFLRSIKKKF
jgi:chaperonin cofactor prefoldin